MEPGSDAVNLNPWTLFDIRTETAHNPRGRRFKSCPYRCPQKRRIQRKPDPAAQALIHGVRWVRAPLHEVDDGGGSDCRRSLAGLVVGLCPPNRLQYFGVPGRLRSQYGVSNCGF
jgi:hypothetical protein